jgi:diaminopropionate ammonia-lyase|tara:strand:+ start:298 stop:1494 length:1197 start_codon:yes stop_codon:yes gene_type:complete
MTGFIQSSAELFLNPQRQDPTSYGADLRALISKHSPDLPLTLLAHCPRHAETPLHTLTGLADQLQLDRLFIKEEGPRLGLQSFKALGGAFAVARLLQRHAAERLGRAIDPSELQSDELRALAGDLTVACATDGNHGRSVAAGARLFGFHCVIYLHQGVSAAREAAIAQFGARIVRCDGDYDDSVRQATEEAAQNGWTVVSDTSWPGYEEIPGEVMQGYTVLAKEALDRLEREQSLPTHLFIQGGVGGVAAALAGYLIDRLGARAPKIILVEPTSAACLLKSAQQGQLSSVKTAHTIMGMLDCGEPSPLAWKILAPHADAFLRVDDGWAVAALRTLAQPQGADSAIVAGESGAAGLAGLLAACAQQQWREALALGSKSRVLLIATESATDPLAYAELVG